MPVRSARSHHAGFAAARGGRRTMRLLCAVLLMLALGTSDVAAQYFGQNKVRYDDFEFKVLRTEHFDIYYYDQAERAIHETARLAERWHARLSTLLEHTLRGRQPLVLYADHSDFQQTTVIPSVIGEGTGGVTEGVRNRIAMPFTASLAETNHVLGHELVHAFQFDMARGGALALPLWFVEGMAEYLSLGPVHAQTALWLRDAARREALPGFDELDNPQFFPYRFGHAAWAYIAGRWGDAAVGAVFRDASQSGDPLGTLEAWSEMPIDELSADWHQVIARTYAVLTDGDRPPTRARALITEAGEGGQLNVGPALSPDGERLVFLSERELFSIEMFLADARTGEIIRKLTEFATNPHVDSIQFLQSTGAWDREGRRFAYAAVKNGRARLVVIDAETGDRLQEIPLSGVGEAINPTWSPDGQSIAFSGLSGGASDLYIYDLTDGQLQQMTRDLYTQIQPAWSPDGRTIALVTDQFTTELNGLAFGPYRLALFDVASGRVRPMPAFPNAKNINPRWSPDGRALYFLADPNGVPNVFRLELSSGDVRPITSVATGVTGITETSPALDVASRTGQVAFTVFTDRTYGIYVIDNPPAAEPAATLVRTNAAQLPPAARASRVAGLLDSPGVGLQPPQDFPVEPYDARLGLDSIGAAVATGFGAGGQGSLAGGGIALTFSDVLNYHQITGILDASGEFRDIGGQLQYLNQSTRWNWGGAFQWLPYVTGSFAQGLTEIDGQTVFVERERLLRQIDRRVVGIAEYPLSRAARFELGAGFRNIAFDREVTTRIFSIQTGRLLQEDTVDLEAPSSLNLAQSTGAFVYDTAVLGATSPVLGMRSRLEATSTFGGLRFTEVLADLRRYVVPVRPLTLAGRVVHFGRYGSDGEDDRLTPLFLGYPSLVRGYEVGSFSAAECQADGVSECPAFDRLVGSRLLIANAELRFPLIGIFQGEFAYGPLPLEGFLFADTGVAWTADADPSFLDGSREFVSSAGAGVRVNAFGYVVLEFAGVRPFDRPDDGWRFVFNIVPGF